MAKFEFKTIINNFMSQKRALNFLKENAVYVGIPEDTSNRDGQEVTNAQLLYIHTNGSKINHIPARPVIEPAIEDGRDFIITQIGLSAQAAYSGDFEKAINYLHKAGLEGVRVSRGWFVNPKNNWQPNSIAVENAKRRKGSTNPRPLIDTGELKKSITYFVDAKGVRQTK